MASLIRAEDGSVIDAIEILEDITRQKEAEEKLKESRDKYQGYIDHSPNALFVVNKNWIWIGVNPVACELTGYNRNEILDKPISMLLPKEDTGTSPQGILQAFRYKRHEQGDPDPKERLKDYRRGPQGGQSSRRELVRVYHRYRRTEGYR